MEKNIVSYLEQLDNFYKKNDVFSENPKNLYEPIKYVLENKGKCIRFSLVLMAEELFLGNFFNSFHSAIALEWFHNFTLIHDDIMDNAYIRRGKPSVFKKWNQNIALLSGDVLMIKCYELLTNNYSGLLLENILRSFNDTAIKVCEGQQMDMDFENIENVEISQYLKMIEYKTAILLANCLKTGAIISKTFQKNIDNIYNFGLNLGLAFQIQDDFLDIFSEEHILGKKIGGDIIEGKKTFPFLKALEVANNSQKEFLTIKYKEKNITDVINILNELNIKDIVKNEINSYFKISLNYLENIETDFKDKKDNLKSFASKIMDRQF